MDVYKHQQAIKRPNSPVRYLFLATALDEPLEFTIQEATASPLPNELPRIRVYENQDSTAKAEQ